MSTKGSRWLTWRYCCSSGGRSRRATTPSGYSCSSSGWRCLRRNGSRSRGAVFGTGRTGSIAYTWIRGAGSCNLRRKTRNFSARFYWTRRWSFYLSAFSSHGRSCSWVGYSTTCLNRRSRRRNGRRSSERFGECRRTRTRANTTRYSRFPCSSSRGRRTRR